tara:strand:+ start:4497 stop:4754 length:258 start_codon:yes stop_codon:yes gene_type:complete
MTLLGPDGKPVMANGPQLVGSKKTLQDMPLLTDEEINNFINAAKHLLDQGTPLEIPAALPTELLVRTAATLLSLKEAQKVEEPEA